MGAVRVMVAGRSAEGGGGGRSAEGGESGEGGGSGGGLGTHWKPHVDTGVVRLLCYVMPSMLVLHLSSLYLAC